MKSSRHSQSASASPLEITCWIALVASGLALVCSAAAIIAGSVYTSAPGILGAAFADEMALFWITLASIAHLAFVPAFCVVVAKRDAHREKAGIPIPEAKSRWKGYESVFLDEDRVPTAVPSRS